MVVAGMWWWGKSLDLIWILRLGGEYLSALTSLQAGHMIYIFYGSLGIMVWKCGSQLLGEVRYKALNEEEENMKRANLTRRAKYATIIY